MASLFTNFLRIDCKKLLKIGRDKKCFLRVACHLPESLDPRKREREHSKQRTKFPHQVFAVAGIVAASDDETLDQNKEEGPEKSAVTQTTASTSHAGHRDKRNNSGHFKKAEGTPKNLARMREGYTKYVTKRKLQYSDDCKDENERPSKRQRRRTEVRSIVLKIYNSTKGFVQLFFIVGL